MMFDEFVTADVRKPKSFDYTMFSLKGCGSICFSIEMCETVLSAVSLFRYENYLIFLSACLYFFPSQIYVISSVIFYYY